MIRRALPLAAALALAIPAAHAQSPSDFLPCEPGATLTPQTPVAVPDPAPETGPGTPPGASDPGPRLVLRGIALDGATAIPETELAPIWADLIGQPVSLDALDAVAARIGAAYRARGFVLSQAAIPEHAERIRDEYLRLAGGGPDRGARCLGGRYRLAESLGRGSFGEVFLAQDSKMRRRVAIKVLDEFRALSAEWRERLIREAEATHRIGDDGSCTVYDVGFEGNVPFLVMPWIQGQSLDRIFSTSAALGRSPVWIRDGLAPSEILPAFLGLIEKVARTLHAAHEGGVIHRDIKPANILVRPDGRPVLIDFGLAWPDETEARATRSATFGTPAYSAPEVRAGELERPDPRVDVWSLGVVLYEGLVGERAFSVAAGRKPANSGPARPIT